jgi:hypothetical protein
VSALEFATRWNCDDWLVPVLASCGQLAAARCCACEEAEALAACYRSSGVVSTGRTMSWSARSVMLVLSAFERWPA